MTPVEQDTLRGGGLTGVDVRHDADVSGVFKGIFLGIIDSSASEDYQRKWCERLVGLGHLVGIFALLHGAPVLLAASMISPARRSFMVFSLRLRA